MWCDHCNHHGHTCEICWQIHGKSTTWVPCRHSEGKDGRQAGNRAYQSNVEKTSTIKGKKKMDPP